jgi:hypothetical protein
MRDMYKTKAVSQWYSDLNCGRMHWVLPYEMRLVTETYISKNQKSKSDKSKCMAGD